jgi:DNA-binding response OmpR family regulator
MSGRTIMLVDDDELLRRSLSLSLERAGYCVCSEATAEDALHLAEETQPDLVLLDIGLPGMDGLDAMRLFRDRLRVPVILLTARRRSFDETLGLELGADDYVTKPFDLDVLLARIKAALRRVSLDTDSQRGSPPVSVAELTVDPGSRTAAIAGQEMQLPPRAFDLLYILARNAGQVVSLNSILDQVWGETNAIEAQVVYVNIRWLRERLAAMPGHSVRIVTRHRIGYVLVADRT